MRALVTGAAGFVGRHLIRHLLESGDDVIGVARPGEPHSDPDVAWRDVDLLDGDATRALIAATRPDAIYHLAGQASVALSWSDPVATFRANIETQLHVLQAVVAVRIDPIVLTIASNEIYGNTAPEHLPTTEDAPLKPANPYAVSKVAQDLLGLQYWLSNRIRCVRARPFTHIGPGQRPDFAIASFARQIALIERGAQPPILHVGNLAARRDMTDVRDMVRAYRLAIVCGEPGAAYNLGRGIAWSIAELLDMLIAQAQTSVSVVVSPDLVRPLDNPVSLCDASRFRARSGWTPQIPMNQTMADILADWRERAPAGEARP
ncbi:MAG: GDP-mannose 4,6-dehydratase [Dehalococcoidia bacterium]|nr:GDP-mannose 4,6-dehydratase [Dehalococcoidia bacterium]